MTQPEDTATVVRALLQRTGAGDPAGIVELYAERVAWELAWPDDEYGGVVPWIRHCSSRADVEDHYRTVAAYTVPEKSTAEVTAVLVDGPDAVIVGKLGQTLRETGVRYRVEFVLHLTISDGLISKHHIVEDNLTIRRAFDAVA